MPTSKEKPDPKVVLVEPAWARVRRVQLIRREIREYLHDSAVDVLFAAAECVVEGSAELARERVADGVANSVQRAYATVMVTIDLHRSAEYFREPADDATAQRVAELMQDNRAVRRRLEEVARPKLAELAGLEPGSLRITLEHQVRAEGSSILIDGDAMGSPRPRRRR